MLWKNQLLDAAMFVPALGEEVANIRQKAVSRLLFGRRWP